MASCYSLKWDSFPSSLPQGARLAGMVIGRLCHTCLTYTHRPSRRHMVRLLWLPGPEVAWRAVGLGRTIGPTFAIVGDVSPRRTGLQYPDRPPRDWLLLLLPPLLFFLLLLPFSSFFLLLPSFVCLWDLSFIRFSLFFFTLRTISFVDHLILLFILSSLPLSFPCFLPYPLYEIYPSLASPFFCYATCLPHYVWIS